MKSLEGHWPILIFVLMFFVLPIATFPGLFDVIFIVLGGFTFVILGLIIASLFSARPVAARSQAGRSNAANGEGEKAGG